MPVSYEIQPITPAPVYLDQHATSAWWGTVLPQFVRLDLTQGLNNAQLVTTNPIAEANQAAAQAGDLLGINAGVKAVEDYLQKNQLNYIVGGVGLLLIAAAVFQVVKP